MFDSVIQNMTVSIDQEKALSLLITDLHLIRRHWIAYPPGHPVVQNGLQKIQQSFQQLLTIQPQVTIGVTRDGLLLGEDYLDKASPNCRAMATALFERGIGALVICQQPSLDELQALLRILALKREEILASGGIEAVWQQTGSSAIELRGIRYDRFSGTEELKLTGDDADSGSLWQRFVQLLMQGQVGLAGQEHTGETRPEVLAATLNALFTQRMGVGSGLAFNQIRDALSTMQAIINAKGTVAPDTASDVSLYPATGDQAGLAAFVAALDPALRRQILDGFCEIGTGDATAMESFFRHLGPGLLQETYATAEQFTTAPELLKGILRKLVPQMTTSYETSSEEEEIRDKVRVLLQEHRQETYIPDDYLDGLQDLLSGTPLRQLAPAILQEELETLAVSAIECRASEIILQLVVTDPEGEDLEQLIHNLSDMCGYFLELGDYAQVLRILSQAASPQVPQQLRLALRDAFSRREFLDEILSGLTIWGKPKYEQVGLLIQVIGRPFLDPLLDRLAEEETMSLRRFMMDRVLAFGEAARPALLERLADSRWYVLRNIIVMLRTLAPGQETDRLRPLLKHANAKVRQEVLKSLLLGGDPIAQRQVMRDLDSADRETQLTALSLVDRSSPPEMTAKLVQLLSTGGYSPVEYELKAACVQALAETGRPEALPELTKVLGSRSLLAFKTLNRLKADIVRSLDRYPSQAALPLLERLAKGSDELASLASEQLKLVRSKTI
ncbi:MAG: HEAT repeat domain-containing protein [Geobacter sp.]